MKNSYKLALLATLGLASASAVQAQSADLIVGVYQPGAANTDVIDLGTAINSLYNGETWDLSASVGSVVGTLTSGTTSSSAFFGVAAYQDNGAGAGASSYYATYGRTTQTLSAADGIGSYSGFQGVKGQQNSVPVGSQVAGTPGAWDQQVQPVNTGSLGGALGFNPDVHVGYTAQFYDLVDDNSAPAKDGTFTFNASTDVLTYNVTAVPEPSTYGLLAGIGLLIVSLRSKFSRQQA